VGEVSAATSKRTFLFYAFHPLGPVACHSIGMPSASFDVDEAQFDATQARLESIPQESTAHICERARWFIEVLGSEQWAMPEHIPGLIGEPFTHCPDCNEPMQTMSMQEMLVRFYTAMRLEETHGQLVR
jgi:hypothetical protein